MKREDKFFVAGHRGLVGSALVRRLTADGYNRIVVQSRSELDLCDAPAVDAFFSDEKPDIVLLAAGRVGGIMANNTYPAEFIRDNLLIQSSVLEAARRHGTRKMLFLGSSCVYPKHAPQPIREEHLLTGPLETTNEAYAIAKIAGLKMCDAYRRQYGMHFVSVMPTNLYGPNDNFDLETSHVLPALVRKFDDARRLNADAVTLWGTGSARREFMHVDDLADACVFLMERYDDIDLINIGCGEDVSIRELAELIRRATGFGGSVEFDSSLPDGTPRKLLDISKLRQLGWFPRIGLEEGIRQTVHWFQEKREKSPYAAPEMPLRT